MTYLIPGCEIVSIVPGLTPKGKPELPSECESDLLFEESLELLPDDGIGLGLLIDEP